MENDTKDLKITEMDLENCEYVDGGFNLLLEVAKLCHKADQESAARVKNR